MEILKVTDAEFKTYGRVLEGYDMTDLLKAMEHAPLPPDEVIYEPSIEELEGLKIADEKNVLTADWRSRSDTATVIIKN